MKRRSLITAAALLPAMSAASASARFDNARQLQILIDQHAAAMAVDDALWLRAGEIEDCPAMRDAPNVRVQTWSLYLGRDAEGTDIREPRYSYSAEEVRRVFQKHIDAHTSTLPGSNSDKRQQQVRASLTAKMQAKLDELDALQAEASRIERECGYTAAMDAARRSADEVKELERDILNIVPSSLNAAAMQAAWALKASSDSFGYLEADQLRAVIKSIAKAGNANA